METRSYCIDSEEEVSKGNKEGIDIHAGSSREDGTRAEDLRGIGTGGWKDPAKRATYGRDREAAGLSEWKEAAICVRYLEKKACRAHHY